MPIKIPSGLPARDILDSERIFALEKPEAERQRVRPLKLVVLNLMPKKVETETQLLRLISKSPLQVEIDFMKTSTHKGTHVSADHLVKFYETLDAFLIHEGHNNRHLFLSGLIEELVLNIEYNFTHYNLLLDHGAVFCIPALAIPFY